MYQLKTESLPIPLRMIVVFAQRVWFVWCCLAFLATGLVALCFYILIFNLFEQKKATKYTYIVTQYWGKALLASMLVRTTSEGTEQLKDFDDSCVIVSNHLSMCDIPICMASSPITFSFLAKQEADKIPVVGYLARNMHVYVDRKSKQSRKETADRMQAHLHNGHSIMIYAEGTRNTTDLPLKDFYDGAFKLAIETQKPLVVVTVCGSDNISTPKEPYKASPSWAHSIWEAPICTKGMTLDDVEQLKQMARNRMLQNLEVFHAQYPA